MPLAEAAVEFLDLLAAWWTDMCKSTALSQVHLYLCRPHSGQKLSVSSQPGISSKKNLSFNRHRPLSTPRVWVTSTAPPTNNLSFNYCLVTRQFFYKRKRLFLSFSSAGDLLIQSFHIINWTPNNFSLFQTNSDIEAYRWNLNFDLLKSVISFVLTLNAAANLSMDGWFIWSDTIHKSKYQLYRRWLF